MERLIKETTNKFAKRFYETLESRGYKLRNGARYVNAVEKVPITCPNGHERDMAPYSLNKGHNCKVCSDSEINAKEKDNFKKRFVRFINNEGYSLGLENDYINSQKPATIKHDKCGYEYKVRPSAFISHGIRCGKCAGKIKRSTEDVKKDIERLSNGEYELISEYNGGDEKIIIRHNSDVCGNYEWSVLPRSFLRNGSRCLSCYRLKNRGEAHPTYNHEITDEERIKGRFLYSTELKRWRTKVFERDDYTCQSCSVRGGVTLHAHHLNGYHWDVRGRFNIVNGVTLCEECHEDFHRVYKKRNNTKEQFEEYINNKYQHT